MKWNNVMKPLVCALVLMWGSGLMATPILNSPDDWGDTPVYVASPISDPAAPTLGSATQSGTGVTIAFTGNGPGPAVRLGDSTAGFSGDFGSLGALLTVNFTLESLDVVPNSLNLYFKTASDTWNSNYTWDLNAMSLDTPTTYSLLIGGVSDWYRYDGSQDFATAFANVTEFGFELVGGGYYSLSQSYVFSNVYFTAGSASAIPEPETVWMILMVLVSLGITFRARLLELGKQALARVRA